MPNFRSAAIVYTVMKHATRRTARLGAAILLSLAIAAYGAHRAANPIARTLLGHHTSGVNICIHHSARDAGKAAELARAFSSDRERINADLGYAGSASVDAWLTTSPYLYNLLCGNPLPLRPGGMRAYDGGASPEGVLLLISPSWQPGTNEQGLRDTGSYILAHEYAHFVVNRINPQATSVQWLNEGLAMDEGARGWPPGLRDLQRAELKHEIAADTVPAIDQLGAGDFNRFVELHGYTYGHSLVRYVRSTYGSQGVQKMVRSGGDVRAALGVSPAELQADWIRFLRREYLN